MKELSFRERLRFACHAFWHVMRGNTIMYRAAINDEGHIRATQHGMFVSNRFYGKVFINRMPVMELTGVDSPADDYDRQEDPPETQ